jgi:hypothetical protein
MSLLKQKYCTKGESCTVFFVLFILSKYKGFTINIINNIFNFIQDFNKNIVNNY